MLVRNVLLCLIMIIICAYRNKTDQVFHINGETQGTTYSISYWATDSLVSKKEIDEVLAQLDSSLSIYKPYSLINKFNNASEAISTDQHLNIVVSKSLEIYRATNGIFDITVYPLVNAWGFGPKKITALPDSSQIRSLLPCVGSEKIRLTNGQLIKTSPCVKIDVNGIAQGYSVDVVANFLKRKGIKNYLVEIGGELKAAGRKPNGEGMKIGIEAPPEHSFDEPVISKIITVTDAAVTTSGNYRKYVESGNQRITHLMDPKTGFPIKSKMVSVTVIAKEAITADGYDNPLMAMTVDEALTFAKKQNIEAYLIYHQANGKLADTATVGFYQILEKRGFQQNK